MYSKAELRAKQKQDNQQANHLHQLAQEKHSFIFQQNLSPAAYALLLFSQMQVVQAQRNHHHNGRSESTHSRASIQTAPKTRSTTDLVPWIPLLSDQHKSTQSI